MSCSICYAEMGKKDYVSLECEHDYHFSCIMTLLATEREYNNKCPMCRKQIISERQIKLKSNDIKKCVQQIIRLTDTLQVFREENNRLVLMVVALAVLLCAISALAVHLPSITTIISFYQVYSWFVVPLCLAIPMSFIFQQHTGLIVN